MNKLENKIAGLKWKCALKCCSKCVAISKKSWALLYVVILSFILLYQYSIKLDICFLSF